MAKIWQKDYELNELIEAFTVGQDYLLDQYLVPSDCAASIAHASMLTQIGILSQEEFLQLQSGLKKIIQEHQQKCFPILPSDEDCHTAIENRLTELCGEAGKKIHTGRSRNDQVITATRLYSKAFCLKLVEKGLQLVDRFLQLAKNEEKTPMPGRTHMQIAMPSSVGLWAASFAEEILDQVQQIAFLYNIIDQNPLGSAASYGVPLPLDRKMTADLMGFDRVQNNVLYANNSRGRFESLLLDGSEQMMLTFSKIAQDLILFSLPEFDYFSLPRVLCSGSSIMPQKKNPDGLELMRAKSATLSGYAQTVKNIVRSLPSGYNRDFQETKEPFIRGSRLILQAVEVLSLTIQELQVNREKLQKAFTPEIYATDKAFDLVARGMSFRDAYRQVGLSLDQVENQNPQAVIEKRTSLGSIGNLNLAYASDLALSLRKENEKRSDFFYSRLKELVGFEFDLLFL